MSERQLNYFKFEVTPYLYTTRTDGIEKTYEIRVTVDGKDYGVTRVPSQVPASISELKYLMHRAVETLEDIINGDETDE